MTERCPLSDLPLDQCACRVHGRGDIETPQGVTFTANYAGTCVECQEPITPGEEIQRAHGGYIHEECT